MSLPCKSERSQLSHEEFEMVRVTHHPAIYELAPDELRAVKLRLQNHRDKARVLARQKQREVKGKAEPRGRSFPGTAELPRKRKQVFAAALKRVNKELERFMKRAFHEVHQVCRVHKCDMRTAAYVLAVGRVAEATRVRGLFP